IEGGTSVNTIASRATALLDMRSTDIAALDKLAAQVEALVASKAGPGLRTHIDVLGERPGGAISLDHPLVQLAAACHIWIGIEPHYTASSTDINIPLSLRIPAVCVGITQVERAHTLEEWLSVLPISNGLAQILRFSIEACSLLAQS
ncbi:MAG TPA: peptidase dimerization domain-containing protein, partial [Ktedonobacteraceae bacterium]